MSAEIFLYRFRDGEPATIERSLVDEIFGSGVGKYEENFIQINYSNMDGGDISLLGENKEGIAVSHCGGSRFFQAMWELADRTQSIIFWPDDPPGLVVTNNETLKHVPEDFIDGFRSAKIVRNGLELSDYYQSAD